MTQHSTRYAREGSPFFVLVLLAARGRLSRSRRFDVRLTTGDSHGGRSTFPTECSSSSGRPAINGVGYLDKRSGCANGRQPSEGGYQGLVAKIKFEAPVAGFLSGINEKYKLRVTELTLAPGGHVGEHNHVGPGIRQVTSGQMTYVLPDKTVVFGPGDYFFESGDINHTVLNETDAPMVHLLFEILPADLSGPSLIPVKHH